jgi:hypothetical protein
LQKGVRCSNFGHWGQKGEVLSGEGEKKFFGLKEYNPHLVGWGLNGDGCQDGGVGFCFCAKMCFFPDGNTGQFFGGAIIALHNYLLIRQLRIERPK